MSKPDEKHLTLCGTPNYISPEVIFQSRCIDCDIKQDCDIGKFLDCYEIFTWTGNRCMELGMYVVYFVGGQATVRDRRS